MILTLMVLIVFILFINPSQAAINCYWNETLVKGIRCDWTHDRDCDILVNCRIKTTEQLIHLVDIPEVVKALDISRNDLTTIKENTLVEFKELVSLNLSRNNIQRLSRDAFNGLVNLKVLDLSLNALLKWDTKNIGSKLPALAILNVTSSPVLWPCPAMDIASLPNITQFIGAVSYVMPNEGYYSNDCAYCTFIRVSTRQSIQDFYYQDVREEQCTFWFYYLRGFNFSSVWKGNFSIICERLSPRINDFCKHTQRLNVSYPSYSSISVIMLNVCWRELQKWTIPFIPLGLTAMFINLLVMLTIASGKSLRNNVAMFFISNMAMGDFSQGLFLVSMTVTRHVMSADDYFDMAQSPHNAVCNSMLTLLIIAQCLSVLVGFLVVLERYFCIVYSMKPDIRITKTLAKLLIVGVWLLTLSAISLPSIFNMKVYMDDYSCANVRSPGSMKPLSEYLGMVGVGIYGLIFVLYAHIFFTVRKSSMNVGIQRESKLAKRIMLVISSNLFFFLAPTIMVFVFVSKNTISNGLVLSVVWNTVVYFCLGINSCVNPLLYAFRNEKFKIQLKKLLTIRRTVQVAPVN